jgi:hypothetical protein
MRVVSSARPRTLASVASVALGVPVIKAAEVEVVVIMDAVVGEDAGVVRGVVASHRKMTSAIVVASWATGPMNAGPKRRRTRPTWSMKRRLH